MSVHTHDSTDFERSFFAHIQTIRLNIHTAIIVGVPDVGDATCKDFAISRTVFNLYLLIQTYSPVNHFLDSHSLLPV